MILTLFRRRARDQESESRNENVECVDCRFWFVLSDISWNIAGAESRSDACDGDEVAGRGTAGAGWGRGEKRKRAGVVFEHDGRRCAGFDQEIQRTASVDPD